MTAEELLALHAATGAADPYAAAAARGVPPLHRPHTYVGASASSVRMGVASAQREALLPRSYTIPGVATRGSEVLSVRGTAYLEGGRLVGSSFERELEKVVSHAFIERGLTPERRTAAIHSQMRALAEFHLESSLMGTPVRGAMGSLDMGRLVTRSQQTLGVLSPLGSYRARLDMTGSALRNAFFGGGGSVRDALGSHIRALNQYHHEMLGLRLDEGGQSIPVSFFGIKNTAPFAMQHVMETADGRLGVGNNVDAVLFARGSMSEYMSLADMRDVVGGESHLTSGLELFLPRGAGRAGLRAGPAYSGRSMGELLNRMVSAGRGKTGPVARTNVAVLVGEGTDVFWRQRMGGDPGVRTIHSALQRAHAEATAGYTVRLEGLGEIVPGGAGRLRAGMKRTVAESVATKGLYSGSQLDDLQAIHQLLSTLGEEGSERVALSGSLRMQDLGLPHRLRDKMGHAPEEQRAFLSRASRLIRKLGYGRKAVQANSRLDRIVGIRRTGTDLVFELADHQNQLSAVKGTLGDTKTVFSPGRLFQFEGRGGTKAIHAIGQAEMLKLNDPRTLRKAVVSHMMAVTQRVAGSTKGMDANQAVKRLAQELGTMTVQGPHGLFLADYADEVLGPVGTGEVLDQGFRRQVASALGFNDRVFDITERELTKAERHYYAQDLMDRGLSRPEAMRVVAEELPRGAKHIFLEGQEMMVQSNPVSARAAGTTGRMRMRMGRYMSQAFEDAAARGVPGAAMAGRRFNKVLTRSYNRLNLARGLTVLPLVQDSHQATAATQRFGRHVSRVSLRDLQKRGGAVGRAATEELARTGSLRTETVQRVLEVFGLSSKDKVGAVVSLPDELRGVIPLALNRPDASGHMLAGHAQRLTVLNPLYIDPSVARQHPSGLMGGMRRAVTGMWSKVRRAEHGSISPSNDLHLMLALLSGDQREIERRAAAATLGNSERLLGSQGRGMHGQLPGVRVKSLVGLQSASTDGAAYVDWQTYADMYYKAAGGRKARRAAAEAAWNSGERKYSMVYREPVHYAGQMVPLEVRPMDMNLPPAELERMARRELQSDPHFARLSITEQERKVRKLARGLKRNTSNHVMVPAWVQAIMQGDVDGDVYNLVYRVGRRDNSQAALAAMAQEHRQTGQVVSRYQRWLAMRDDERSAADLAGLVGKSAEKLRLRAQPAEGYTRRLLQYGPDLVGAYHTWQQLQLGVLRTLSGMESGAYNSVGKQGAGLIGQLAEEYARTVGADPTTAHGSAYVEGFYKILKKRTGAQEQAAELVDLIHRHAAGGPEALVDDAVALMQDTISFEDFADLTDADHVRLMQMAVDGADAATVAAAQEQLYRRQFLSMSAVQRAHTKLKEASHGVDAVVTPSEWNAYDRGRFSGWKNSRVGRILRWLSGGDRVDIATNPQAATDVGRSLPGIFGDNVERVATEAAQDSVPRATKGAAAESFGELFASAARNKWVRWGAAGMAAAAVYSMASSSTPAPPPPLIRPGGNSAPLPPRPMVQQPLEMPNPGAHASIPPTARIERVMGQRRHFPSSPPSPRMPSAPTFQPGSAGYRVGMAPTTPSQAEAMRRAELAAQGYRRDF